MDLFKEIDAVQEHFERPINVSTYNTEDGNTFKYNFDTRGEIALITFMSASKYLKGNIDELGVKPFYNIVNQIVDLEVRATDIDTKNFILRPDSPEYEVHALLATKAIHQWFDENNFAETLNQFGEIGARYGNVLLKRSYVDGKINVEVVNWSAIAFDQFDIEGGAKVETHYMTALDLQKKRGVWNEDVIDEAIRVIESKTSDSYTGDDKNTRDIEVLEYEGELARSLFTENENDEGFSIQHYFVIKDAQGTEDLILFQEELKTSNYIYYGRKKLDGRGWALGVVEQGKEAQGEVNLLKIAERRAIEMASKKLYVTDDDEYDDNNVLVDKENGDVLFVNSGKYVRELPTVNGALPQFVNAKDDWVNQFKSSQSAFDSVTGDTMPSGTAYRLGLLQAKQANSIFKYIQQGKGIVLKRVVSEWILPDLFKSIDKEFILEAGFSAKELDLIHSRFATVLANQKVLNMLDRGELPDALTYEEMIQEIQDNIPRKDIQFMDIKKGFFKEAKKHIRIDITGESEDTEAKIATLNSLLQIAQQDQAGLIFPPEATKELVREITRLANISSIEFGLGMPNKKGNDLAPEQAGIAPQGQAPVNIQGNGQANSELL